MWAAKGRGNVLGGTGAPSERSESVAGPRTAPVYTPGYHQEAGIDIASAVPDTPNANWLFGPLAGVNVGSGNVPVSPKPSPPAVIVPAPEPITQFAAVNVNSIEWLVKRSVGELMVHRQGLITRIATNTVELATLQMEFNTVTQAIACKKINYPLTGIGASEVRGADIVAALQALCPTNMPVDESSLGSASAAASSIPVNVPKPPPPNKLNTPVTTDDPVATGKRIRTSKWDTPPVESVPPVPPPVVESQVPDVPIVATASKASGIVEYPPTGNERGSWNWNSETGSASFVPPPRPPRPVRFEGEFDATAKRRSATPHRPRSPRGDIRRGIMVDGSPIPMEPDTHTQLEAIVECLDALVVDLHPSGHLHPGMCTLDPSATIAVENIPLDLSEAVFVPWILTLGNNIPTRNPGIVGIALNYTLSSDKTEFFNGRMFIRFRSEDIANCFRDWLNKVDCYGGRLRVPHYRDGGKTIEWLNDRVHSRPEKRKFARFGELIWTYWPDLPCVTRGVNDVTRARYDYTKSPPIEFIREFPRENPNRIMQTELAIEEF